MRFSAPTRYLLLIGLLLIGGCGTPSILLTPVDNTNKLEESCVMEGKGLFPDKIAIIELDGIISNSRTGGLLGSGENPISIFTQELQKAADDSSIKAVVIRVNSPGGTVSASDAMYQMLKRFKDKTHKPVVASIQEVGASGAYYISCASDKIVAQPTSLVGSIGVIFETFNLQGTMSKLGVQPENYKSAAHKDIGSPFREPTPEEKQIMQGLVDDYYARFKSVVISNRPIPNMADFPMITDGRVFSGDKAVEIGLVDKTGLLEDAIQLAKDLSKQPDAKVVLFKRPYGYGGSIYADTSAPTPKANVLQLELPEAASMLPTGFYYIWKP
jgi:protease-4